MPGTCSCHSGSCAVSVRAIWATTQNSEMGRFGQRRHAESELDLSHPSLFTAEPVSGVICHVTALAPKNSERSQMKPSVAILLCTFNGQRYLEEQLNSFDTQDHHNWTLWASDDGSTDNTIDLLSSYQNKWPKNRLNIKTGPSKGFAANFLALLNNGAINADYYAYSDQDDIWNRSKLSRAIRWLESMPRNIPALYCTRTQLIDEIGTNIGFSPLFKKSPGFANALVQNIGGGNTMVFNEAARNLMKEAGLVDVCTHDWWTYIVVSGCGGNVFYDPMPSLLYRQHEANLCGSNQGWLARVVRIRMLWQGRFRQWNGKHIQALQKIRHQLTPESAQTLARFSKARDKALLPRIYGLKRSGIYRQTLLGNLGLVFGAVFKRI